MKGTKTKAGGTYAAKKSKKSAASTKSRRVGNGTGKCAKCGEPYEIHVSAAVRTRMQLDRMLQIHEELRRNKFPTQEELADEVGCERKTVIADIRFMQTRLHMPLEYNPEKRGWGYTQPMVEFPLLYITEEELITLCVAARALAAFPGTTFHSVLQRILEKLSYSLRDRLSFRLDDVEAAISFGPAAAPAVDPHVYAELKLAALNGEEIECTYQGLKGAESKRRLLQPVHVTPRNGVWYFLVQDPTRKQKIATYKISRASNVKRTGRLFTKLPRSEWETVLASSVGIYSGAKPESVTLRLTELGVKLLTEHPVHPSQQINASADGAMELTVNVPITPELERVILGWGAEVRVLEPAALRQSIIATARKVAGWGKEEPSVP